MSTQQQTYSLELQRKPRGDAELIYRAGEWEVRLYLTLTLGGDSDYIAQGLDAPLSGKVEPLSPEEQLVVRERVEAWAREKRMRLEFAPTLSREESIENAARFYASKGWVREDLPDRSARFSPPPRNIVERVWRWFVS